MTVTERQQGDSAPSPAGLPLACALDLRASYLVEAALVPEEMPEDLGTTRLVIALAGCRERSGRRKGMARLDSEQVGRGGRALAGRHGAAGCQRCSRSDRSGLIADDEAL